MVLFVDRKKVAGKLPGTVDRGQRVRVVLMDRLHVTRSHGTPVQRHSQLRQRIWVPGRFPSTDSIKLP